MAPRAPGNVCPSCGSDDLLRITMMVGGRPLSFTACHECEAKWWQRDGAQVPLRSVIALASNR
jgi:DNA polymerase III alpha subunit (gram-positive type)